MSEIKFKAGTSIEGKTLNESDVVMINNNMNNLSENSTIDNKLGSVYKGSKIVGTTKANELCLTEDLIVAGGVLANNITESGEEWPFDTVSGVKTIKAGTSIQDVLSNLFLKVKNGTVSWNEPVWSPSLEAPSISIETDGTVEVGTIVKPIYSFSDEILDNIRTCTLKATEGYFTGTDEESTWNSGGNSVYKQSKEGNVEGSLSYTLKWNDTTIDLNSIPETGLELEVQPGENKLIGNSYGFTASVEALDAVTVYASTNTKKVLPDVSSTLSDTKPENKQLSKSTTDKITGAYKYFIGCYSDNTYSTKTYTSQSLRNNDMKFSDFMNGLTVNETITVPAGTKGMYIAIPEGVDDTGSTLNVILTTALNSPVASDMIKNIQTVSVNCAGTYTKNYKVFTWRFDGGTEGAETFLITKF